LSAPKIEPCLNFSKKFATRDKTFRRNKQMDHLVENQAEMKELRLEKSFGSLEDADSNAGMSMPIKDADTTLSMIVLLLACLALAALAHVVV
jgi:hypothetical protein